MLKLRRGTHYFLLESVDDVPESLNMEEAEAVCASHRGHEFLPFSKIRHTHTHSDKDVRII